MRTAWGVVVIVICFAAGTYVFLSGGRNEEERRAEIRKALTGYYYCEKCSKEFLSEGGGKFAVCPQCGQKTQIARVKMRCANTSCGHEFVQYDVDIVTNACREPDGDWGEPPSFDPCPVCDGKDLISLPEKE